MSMSRSGAGIRSDVYEPERRRYPFRRRLSEGGRRVFSQLPARVVRRQLGPLSAR